MPIPKPLANPPAPEREIRVAVLDGDRAELDIPVEVLAALIVQLLRADLLSPSKTETIFDAAAQSLSRLGGRIPSRFH